MIKFSLICDRAHEFESWFQDSDAFEHLKDHGAVECPQCNSSHVSKAVMSPFVAARTRLDKSQGEGSSAHLALADQQQQIRQQMRALHEHVTKNAENVGEAFTEEARKQHFGETEPRAIYGKASMDDVSEMLEEGIPVFPLPDVADEMN
jgi:hypothetical protein